MKRHTKVYMDYFGYVADDTILCEICGNRAVDIAHIVARSKFGKKTMADRDDISNLCALCRECHYKYDFENKISIDEIRDAHRREMDSFKKIQ
jgi:hypothetical protein